MGIGLSVLDGDNPDGPPKSFIPAREGENIYGRHAIAPDPQDKNRKLLSRRHFTLQVKGTTVSLRDFGSINGTFIPVVGTLRLNEGDEIHAGSQRFRFDGMEKGGVAEAVVAAPAPAEAAAPSAAPEKAAPAAPEKPAAKKPAEKKPAAAEMPAGGNPALVIANAEIGDTVPTSAEMSVLEKLMEAGFATDKREKLGGKYQALYSCKSGSCGLCVIRVLGGADNVSKANGKEKRTLKTMVETLNEDLGRALDPAECRLACVAKVTGPVQIELLGDTDAAD